MVPNRYVVNSENLDQCGSGASRRQLFLAWLDAPLFNIEYRLPQSDRRYSVVCKRAYSGDGRYAHGRFPRPRAAK